MQSRLFSGSCAGSRDILLNYVTAYISPERLQLESPARAMCGAFDAAFAKLLWPLVTT